jgi:hypothetical protein
MSTFYLLPSRHLLGRQFADVLGTLFSGLNWPSSSWPDLAELLGGAAVTQQDVYVVFRDDLPDGVGAEDGLSIACGAEAGDEVVEVLPGAWLGDVDVRRWRLDGQGRVAA